ncbi:MAG: hypothetical protein AAGA00_02355 [Pseudomonadota bacterium]
MDITDYFVLIVGLAVVAIVVYGGYHRARQTRAQTDRASGTRQVPSGVPAE